MGTDLLQDLFVLVEDQLRSRSDVRIRVTPPVKPMRAPDLPPLEAEDQIQFNRGVYVRTARREFFFDVEWLRTKQYSRISDLIDEIYSHSSGSTD